MLMTFNPFSYRIQQELDLTKDIEGVRDLARLTLAIRTT